MSATVTDLDALKEEMTSQLDRIRTEYKAKAGEVLALESQKVFEKYPDLLGFAWHQYTGYFCDGDPCNFNVYRDSEAIKLLTTKREEPSAFHDGYTYGYKDLGDGTVEVDYYSMLNEGSKYNYDKGAYDQWTIENPYNHLSSAIDDITTILAVFDETMLEHMFGDGVEVWIMRDGVTRVDEYEHE